MLNNEYPVEARNIQLIDLFTSLGYDAKLIGNPNQPKIIIDSCYAISGYVHNRLYHFTTKPFGGNVVKTVDIRRPDIKRQELDDLIDSCEKRKLWKVGVAQQYCDKNLYYVKTEEKVPLFSFDDRRFFFDQIRAERCQQYLSNSFDIVCFVEETIA